MATMIKFRAWDKAHECYLYDVQGAYDMISGFVKYENGDDADYYEECFAGFLDNDQYVVEQFTGLKDVNGKDIYEGDIIASKPNGLTFEPLKIGVVKRSKITAGWSYITATGEYNIWTSGKYRTYEIIGNVHANPELLEENK
ncbi:prophage P1 protein 30 [Lactiplantibacillus plantarum]|nr:prophage P1 protein 30 [Lactiplantibacillus plantarum]